ncbi:MAG: LuxR C-terminal-related transcriptional regulator [Thermoleophilia bacterium]|jgi:ATP/maltotriose-dependent transcriptional regulator MalT
MCCLVGTDLYRFHPLFRAFLRSRLEDNLSSEDIELLQVRIARVLEDIGAKKEAVELYTDANKYKDAVRLLEIIGEDLLRNCEYVTIESLLNKIGDQGNSPLLKMYHGKLLMAYGKSERAIYLLKAAKQEIINENIEIRSSCALSIAECLSDLGRNLEGIKEIEPFLEMSLDPKLRIDIIYRICVNYWNLFNDKKVEFYCSKAKSLAYETSMEDVFIKFRVLQALQSLRIGDFKHGYIYLKEVIKSDGYALYLRNLYRNNLASCLMMLGKYEQAALLAEECLVTAVKQKDNKWLPLILDSYGCILQAIGEDGLGKHYIQQAVVTVENMENKRNAICAAMCHLGTYERRKGNFAKAYEVHVKSYENAEEHREHYDMAMCKSNLGADSIRMGDNNEAVRHFRNAEDIACKFSFRYVLTNIDFHRAWAAHLSGDNENEKIYLNAALRRARKYQHNHFMIQEGKISLPLFTTALSNDIESDYVSMILEIIGESALFALEPLLSSRSVELRNRITKLIGRIGGRNAVTLLHRLLRDEDANVRGSAKSILANLRYEKKLPSDILTSREMEVLGVLATGASNRQISELLFISEPTVKSHINKIFRKLGISRRLEAVLYFQQMENSN